VADEITLEQDVEVVLGSLQPAEAEVLDEQDVEATAEEPEDDEDGDEDEGSEIEGDAGDDED
jgi:hypothetical protein